MNKTLLLTFLLNILLSSILFSQTDNQNERKTTRPLTKWEKKYQTVRYGENIYKTGSNWLTLGVGAGLHTNKNKLNRNISLTYFQRVRGMYFNAGAQYNAPIKYNPNLHVGANKPQLFLVYKQMEKLTDIHIGAGLRFEDRWFNFGFFIGPSYSVSYIPREDKKGISTIYHDLGAVTQLQFTFKYLYDLGIGTTLFGSFNKHYQVIGIQLHLYFSNAFKMKY